MEWNTNKTFFLVVVLAWFSGLFIWAVRAIDTRINVPNGVGITGAPSGGFLVTQQSYAVPMGNNTVWFISPYTQDVQVITRDKNGFHWSTSSHK